MGVGAGRKGGIPIRDQGAKRGFHRYRHGDPNTEANRGSGFSEVGGISAPRTMRGNGTNRAKSLDAYRVQKGATMGVDLLSAISPRSWAIDRRPMATPFRDLGAAKNSPNSGEYRPRGGGAEMARKMGNP